MMATGLLWYDDDTRRPLALKVAEAAQRYRERSGYEPTTCQLNPTLMPAPANATRKRSITKVPEITLRLEANEHLRPNYFYVGVAEGERLKRAKDPTAATRRTAASAESKTIQSAKPTKALKEPAKKTDVPAAKKRQPAIAAKAAIVPESTTPAKTPPKMQMVTTPKRQKKAQAVAAAARPEPPIAKRPTRAPKLAAPAPEKQTKLAKITRPRQPALAKAETAIAQVAEQVVPKPPKRATKRPAPKAAAEPTPTKPTLAVAPAMPIVPIATRTKKAKKAAPLAAIQSLSLWDTPAPTTISQPPAKTARKKVINQTRRTA